MTPAIKLTLLNPLSRADRVLIQRFQKWKDHSPTGKQTCHNTKGIAMARYLGVFGRDVKFILSLAWHPLSPSLPGLSR